MSISIFLSLQMQHGIHIPKVANVWFSSVHARKEDCASRLLGTLQQNDVVYRPKCQSIPLTLSVWQILQLTEDTETKPEWPPSLSNVFCKKSWKDFFSLRRRCGGNGVTFSPFWVVAFCFPLVWTYVDLVYIVTHCIAPPEWHTWRV